LEITYLENGQLENRQLENRHLENEKYSTYGLVLRGCPASDQFQNSSFKNKYNMVESVKILS